MPSNSDSGSDEIIDMIGIIYRQFPVIFFFFFWGGGGGGVRPRSVPTKEKLISTARSDQALLRSWPYRHLLHASYHLIFSIHLSLFMIFFFYKSLANSIM